MYSVATTNRFDKDVERLQKQRIDLAPLRTVVNLLSSGQKMPDVYRDHPLKGKDRLFRECHVGPHDWVLKYLRDKKRLVLVLVRTGTHRDVLGIE